MNGDDRACVRQRATIRLSGNKQTATGERGMIRALAMRNSPPHAGTHPRRRWRATYSPSTASGASTQQRGASYATIGCASRTKKISMHDDNEGKPWSDTDIRDLTAAYLNGQTLEDTARLLRRTSPSVATKARQLAID